MFLYFVQTALLIAGPGADWLQWLTFLNFTPQQGGTPCPANLDAYQQMALSIVVAMLFFALLGITLLLHCVIRLGLLIRERGTAASMFSFAAPSSALRSTVFQGSLHSYRCRVVFIQLFTGDVCGAAVLALCANRHWRIRPVESRIYLHRHRLPHRSIDHSIRSFVRSFVRLFVVYN